MDTQAREALALKAATPSTTASGNGGSGSGGGAGGGATQTSGSAGGGGGGINPGYTPGRRWNRSGAGNGTPTNFTDRSNGKGGSLAEADGSGSVVSTVVLMAGAQE